MNRNHFVATHGDATNAIRAAAGFNFRLLILWLRSLCAWIAAAMIFAPTTKAPPSLSLNAFFTSD